MITRNLSQEAYLWYTITSPDYIAQAKVKLEEATAFIRDRATNHPFIAGYAPVPHWGGVMEDLLDRFDSAFSMLKQGEFNAMSKWASQMQTIPRGFRESNLEWLSQSDQKAFTELLDVTFSVCDEFLSSIAMSKMYSDPNYKNRSAEWNYEIPTDMGIAGDDIARYHEEHIFPILPKQIPEYAPDCALSCKTGDIVPWAGVWVPSTGMGTAALAFARQDVQIMQPAYEIASFDEDGFAESFNLVECIWHPVKPTGRMVPHPSLSGPEQQTEVLRLRCEANQPCPREGWWFTPASTSSRRHFSTGETMPVVNPDYGVNIWQWDHHQSE